MGKSKRSKPTGDDAQKVDRDEEVRISTANLVLGLRPFVPRHKKKAHKHAHKRVAEMTAPAAEASSSDESTGESNSTNDTSEKSSNEQPAAAKEAPGVETPTVEVQSESESTDDTGGAESSSAPKSSDAEPGTHEQASEAASNGKSEKSEKSVSFADGESQTDESVQISSPRDDSTTPSKDVSVEETTAGTQAGTQAGKWTESEDAMIVGMKEDNASWAVIGNAIGRGKNEVKKRYHEIKVVKANAAAVQDGEKDATKEVKKSMEAENTNDTPGDGNRHNKKKNNNDKFTSKNGCKKKASKKSKSPPKPAHSTASTSLSAMEAALLASPASSTTDDEPGGYDADDYDPYAPGPHTDPIAHERERRRQDRFMQRHLWAALYPRRTAAEDFAGQGFSRRDRRLLAELEDRRLGNRWLEMQANFFNATGRMLPLHLIKAKLEGQSPTDEQQMLPRVARFQQMVAKWNSSVADSEELLDPASAGEAPVDAMK
ncbi:hypothetical protein ACHAQA_000762 [Verticillium albo-atrum]